MEILEKIKDGLGIIVHRVKSGLPRVWGQLKQVIIKLANNDTELMAAAICVLLLVILFLAVALYCSTKKHKAEYSNPDLDKVLKGGKVNQSTDYKLVRLIALLLIAAYLVGAILLGE